MTDYGMMRRRGPSIYRLLAIGTVAAGVAVFVAWETRDLLQRRAAAVTLAEGWAIQGEPCPQLSAEAFAARGLKAPKAFEFEGVTMARRYGHVSCAMLHTKGGKGLSSYPVCQFTGPGSLHVTTPRGEAWFEPGIGRAATVSTAGGEARCVLASKFRLEKGRLTDG